MEKTRKIPLRQCLGCREMKSKRDLIRIVRVADAEAPSRIVIDSKGKVNGRGAYVCADKNCLTRIRKSGAVGRQLGEVIPNEIWEQLEAHISAAESNDKGGTV